MSRHIDTTQPLTDEDERYLADRGRTVEQEQSRQRAAALATEIVTGNAEELPARVEYARRTGQGPTPADMAEGFVRRGHA